MLYQYIFDPTSVMPNAKAADLTYPDKYSSKDKIGPEYL